MSGLKKNLKLGATGALPDGKIAPDDEGEIRFAVSSGAGMVKLDFGKPVTWLVLPAESAKELAGILLIHASAGMPQ